MTMETGRTTKAQLLRDMLARPDGAGLEEICKATGWQPHSARAAISGLRKAGAEVELVTAGNGAGRCYRMTVVAARGAGEPREDAVKRRRRAAVPDATGAAAMEAPDTAAGGSGRRSRRTTGADRPAAGSDSEGASAARKRRRSKAGPIGETVSADDRPEGARKADVNETSPDGASLGDAAPAQGSAA